MRGVTIVSVTGVPSASRCSVDPSRRIPRFYSEVAGGARRGRRPGAIDMTRPLRNEGHSARLPRHSETRAPDARLPRHEAQHARFGGTTMMRRNLLSGLIALTAVLALASWPGGLDAQGKVVRIGLSLPLTGADADGADAILKGAQLAINEINAKGGVAGYKLEAQVFDSATPAAGQYDPAQAATNYKKFVADSLTLAAV